MKKIIVISALFITSMSCNSNQNNEASGDTTNNAGLTNPSAIDTTKHPDGMINGNVISTDTAAINVQNSENKAKEAKKNK
jgi:hypothetical protein